MSYKRPDDGKISIKREIVQNAGKDDFHEQREHGQRVEGVVHSPEMPSHPRTMRSHARRSRQRAAQS